ncbi:MAG: hypothetical protein EB090_06900 [Verrucomicrobia bacterium]|nr:hypothetical protein [Verrucomicrobiota bacterium]
MRTISMILTAVCLLPLPLRAWDGQYSVEQKDPIEKFPKWTGILASVAEELQKKADINAPYAGGWEEFVQKNQSGDRMEMIKKVNETFNSMRYVPDQKNWGVPDLWNTPVQFTQPPDYVVPGRVSGDCEDHAIAKYYALQKLGFTQDELRILVVKDLNLGVGHCILGVIYGGQCLILDNQIKSVWSASQIQHYKPIYAINEQHWWQFVPAGEAAPEAAAARGGGAGQGD